MSEQLKTGFGASVPRKEDRRFSLEIFFPNFTTFSIFPTSISNLMQVIG